MSDRKLEFKVRLPQLEEVPGTFNSGVKRYRLHKNENSPALVLGGGSFLHNFQRNMSVNYPAKAFPSSEQVFGQKKASNLGNSSMAYYEMPTKHREPLKFSKEDRVSKDFQNLIELMNHPAFKTPTFTKNKPKINGFNPIVGYPIAQSVSPQPKKRFNLVEYGSLIFPKKSNEK